MLDVYRHVHGNNVSSFTWFKADMSQKSRIDLWLISDLLILFISSCTISPAPLADHACIDLEISETHNSFKRRPGYWKLNTSLLQNSLYCLGIKNIVEKFKVNSGSAIAKWELFKYECRRFSIQFGKQLSKAKESRSSAIIKEINYILCLSSPSEQDREKLYIFFFVINNFFIFIFSQTTQHNIQNKTKQNSRHILNISKFNQKGGREGRTTRTQKLLL